MGRKNIIINQINFSTRKEQFPVPAYNEDADSDAVVNEFILGHNLNRGSDSESEIEVISEIIINPI